MHASLLLVSSLVGKWSRWSAPMHASMHTSSSDVPWLKTHTALACSCTQDEHAMEDTQQQRGSQPASPEYPSGLDTAPHQVSSMEADVDCSLNMPGEQQVDAGWLDDILQG